MDLTCGLLGVNLVDMEVMLDIYRNGSRNTIYVQYLGADAIVIYKI